MGRIYDLLKTPIGAIEDVDLFLDFRPYGSDAPPTYAVVLETAADNPIVFGDGNTINRIRTFQVVVSTNDSDHTKFEQAVGEIRSVLHENGYSFQQFQTVYDSTYKAYDTMIQGDYVYGSI